MAALSNGNGSLKSLKLMEFSDRELLLILNDVADHEGYASAVEVAAKLHLDHPRPHQCVSVRFSWLARYGALEREHMRDEHGNLMWTGRGLPRHTQRWRMTAMGRAMAVGALTKTQEAQLGRIGDDRMLMLTRYLSQRARSADPVAAKLVEREWRYSTGSRT